MTCFIHRRSDDFDVGVMLLGDNINFPTHSETC